MRVGNWSPLVVMALIICYTSIIKFKPTLEFAPIALGKLNEEIVYFIGMPRETIIDLAIFLWGIIVMVHARISLGSIGAFPISFTGWSWILLTSRAGLEFSAWVLASKYNNILLATKIAAIGSSIRLVTLINACVVCTIWNFVLFPIMYFVSIPKEGDKRRNFLKFNFGFFMTNIHILNFPLSCMNIINGDRVRMFTVSDLWVAYLVVLLYSMLYLFVMDRLGLHFYPIFNPRTSFTVISFVSVLGLYYYLFLKWNEHISL